MQPLPATEAAPFSAFAVEVSTSGSYSAPVNPKVTRSITASRSSRLVMSLFGPRRATAASDAAANMRRSRAPPQRLCRSR